MLKVKVTAKVPLDVAFLIVNAPGGVGAFTTITTPDGVQTVHAADSNLECHIPASRVQNGAEADPTVFGPTGTEVTFDFLQKGSICPLSGGSNDLKVRPSHSVATKGVDLI